MRAYAVRRLLMVIPTLVLVTVLVFLSVRFLPGDVIEVMQARLEASQGGEIDRAALERRLGLDVPVYVQYGRWVGGIVLRGTLGQSLMGRRHGGAEHRSEITGDHTARPDGDRHRAGDRRAGRYLLGDSPGYGRRLRGAGRWPSLAWRRPTSGWPPW